MKNNINRKTKGVNTKKSIYRVIDSILRNKNDLRF